MTDAVSNWYHCPKCNKPVDPIPAETWVYPLRKIKACPDCGTEVGVRDE